MPHRETERALTASATASKPNIECHNIARFFPPSTRALKNATLSIHEGESVAITGASGSGKSTLLSIIGLLDQPSEGELKILGQNMGTASNAERTVARREHIAFVFQAYHLIAHLNATENIAHTPPGCAAYRAVRHISVRCRHSNRWVWGTVWRFFPAICPVVNSKESRLRVR